MRLLRLTLASLGVLAALPARAATIAVGSLSMLLYKQNDDGKTYAPMNDMEAQEFFNAAHCTCNSTFSVHSTLVGAPTVLANGDSDIQFWLGSACNNNDATTRAMTCIHYTQADQPITNFQNVTVDVPINSALVMFPLGGCGPAEGSANTVWGLVDTDGDSMWDSGGVFQLLNAEGTQTVTIQYDTKPPTPVTTPTATGVENGFNVSWGVNTADVPEMRGYQVLCKSVATGGPLFIKPSSGPEYMRPDDVPNCNPSASSGSPDAGVGSGDIDAAVVPDAPVGDAGTTQDDVDFANFDPRFICSSLQEGGTPTSVRIDLGDGTNMVEGAADMGIVAKVVAIDMARNYSGADATASGPPVPVRDAWEYYHDQGGQADGGYCFVATAAYGDYDHPYVKVLRRFRDETLAPTAWGRGFIAWYYAHSPPWADFLRAHPVARVTAAILLFPVVVLAAVWNSLGIVGLLGLALLGYALVRWRRRRVVKIAAATAVLALVVAVGGGRAHAQIWYDDPDQLRDAPRGPSPPDWTFEIKLGPYFPHIDDEPGVMGAPYATTFGSGSSLLTQSELDYYFFHPLGELGIGLSGGYMSNTAKAFIQVMDPKTGLPVAKCTDNTSNCRSSDDTGFSMIPLALLAVYRFTAIADRTVVPIVPYAKVGLSYYIWHMTKGNGDTSSVNGQDAAGGTLGWQGTIGLSLRADKLDPESAHALSSDLGVDHIGFFGEMTYADVSGLGADHKLRVGDFTWSAGMNFEF